MADLVDLYNAQPVVVWDRPAALAVQVDPADDGLGWHLMAVNASLEPIEGDVQVEWRLPESARDKVLIFSTNAIAIQRSFVVDSVMLNRPESFIHLWMGERFTVSLQPGEFVELTGTLMGSPDIDQDGVVDSGDIADILAAWGGNCCQADVNCDGEVRIEDLTLVLGALGG